jgi:transcriptional regulator with XRE-family HTH domain
MTASLPSGTAFGHRLRELRLEKKITLTAMAKILGVTASYLSQIETGKKSSVSPVMLDQICAILGLIWDDAEEIKRLARQSKSRVKIDTTTLGPEATRAANLISEVLSKVDEDEAKLMANWLEDRLKP